MNSAVDRIYLLGIDLTSAPDELRDALCLDDEELVTLLQRVRTEVGGLELAAIATSERIELYGSGAQWRAGFRMVLRHLSARAASLPGLGALRVLEAEGVPAARHLMRITAGLETSLTHPQALAAVDAATRAAKAAETLGDDLRTLFDCASLAAARRVRETNEADGELAEPEVERIVEEELLSWQASCARESRRVLPEPSRQSGFPSEPFTFIREIKARRTVA